MLARFGAAWTPALTQLPDADRQAVQAWLARRTQLVEMRTMERQRLQQARVAALRTRIEAHLTWLTAELAETDRDLQTRLRTHPVWQAALALLISVPGVGWLTAGRLMARLPELGHLPTPRLAATMRKLLTILNAILHQQRPWQRHSEFPGGVARPALHSEFAILNSLVALPAPRCILNSLF